MSFMLKSQRRLMGVNCLLMRNIRGRHFPAHPHPHQHYKHKHESRHFPTAEHMKSEYLNYLEIVENFKAETSPSPSDRLIFANNEIQLSRIQVYGFDYDYTLVEYTDDIEQFIYCKARDMLINRLKYPQNIKHLNFNPTFAVRGLHYDIMKGLIMKVDAFHNIQLGTVYRGLTPLTDEEVFTIYKGTHIGKEYLTNRGQFQTMTQLIDTFAKPEMNLLANVIEYFNDHDIEYDPEYVFHDVSRSVRSIHKSGELHQEIMSDIERYVIHKPETRLMLERLKFHGKQVFMISNSDIKFINEGMNYVVGKDWKDMFDVIVVNARKPSFFTEDFKPFRISSPNGEVGENWGKVTQFIPGQIYREGNLRDLQTLTGWHPRRVLYFGDHVYSDLADVSNNHGWRTGAIIPELKTEVEITNSAEFRYTINRIIELERLIDENQNVRCSEGRSILKGWNEERNDLRYTAKKLFNPQFGSIFRTFHNHSYFTQRLARYADLYTSSVTTIFSYPLTHTFYPRRIPLPHEDI